MATEQIDRASWAPFLATITKSLDGKLAQVEVASLELGDQIAAEWLPLLGMAYDDKDDLIEIALEGLDHLIRHPRQLYTQVGPGGILAIAIADGDGNHQIVRLRDPLALGAPQSAASPAHAQ
jgi:hypothetical protein